MEKLMLAVVVIVFINAAVVAVLADLLAWMCGRAIRRVGRCFEEGRIQARTAAENIQIILPQQVTFVPTASVTPAAVRPPAASKPAAPFPAADDAGHRWLGNTGGSKG